MKVVAVLSGKGGVGKTTISVAIARALTSKYRVGLLDADVVGSNAHRLVKVLKSYDISKVGDEERIIPAEAEIDGKTVQFMSIALLSESYVGWAPGEHGEFIEQIMKKTNWDVDFLVIDTPPGTHSEVLTALKYADVAILVTLPAELSHLDVRRTVELLADKKIPVAGQIVNMSYAICPKCGTELKLFRGSGGVEGIPVIQEVPFVDGLPEIDLESLLNAIENPIIIKPKRKPLKRALIKFLLKTASKLGGAGNGKQGS